MILSELATGLLATATWMDGCVAPAEPKEAPADIGERGRDELGRRSAEERGRDGQQDRDEEGQRREIGEHRRAERGGQELRRRSDPLPEAGDRGSRRDVPGEEARDREPPPVADDAKRNMAKGADDQDQHDELPEQCPIQHAERTERAVGQERQDQQIGSSIEFAGQTERVLWHQGAPNRPSGVLGRLRRRMAGVRWAR